MLRSVTLLFVVLVIGCGSNEEPANRSVPTTKSEPRIVSSDCREILAAKRTIDKFNKLYQDTYSAISSGRHLSLVANSRDLDRSQGSVTDEISTAVERLGDYDDAYASRWPQFYSMTGRAGSFVALVEKDKILTGDDRYLTLQQIRGPANAMLSIGNYAKVISRENSC